MFRKIGLLVVCMILSASSGIAQKLDTGPQVLSIFSNIDDSEQPYGLYLPKDFKSDRKYPLVIMLHGAWSNHRLALRRVFGKSNQGGETDVEATRYFPPWDDIDYIVATPLARGTMGYQGVAEKDVYDVLADVERRFPIDSNRVYLTGLSMGGGGTLWIGLTRPDIWAAIAPVCPAPPREAEEFAPNALNIPVAIFQGGADPVVAPDSTRAWVKRLKDLETTVEYTEYPGVGHNSWENAYKDEQIFKWFSQYTRDPYPPRVRFVTDRYKYSSAYWVTIDQLTPGVLASVDARFARTNQIEIVSSNTNAFTFYLGGHPMFDPGMPLRIRINGQAISVGTDGTITFINRDNKWYVGTYDLPVHSKVRDAEGPLSEAFASRHVYVFGTEGVNNLAAVAGRRAEADAVSKWQGFTPLLYFPRVIADREVRESDYESSNLILFGNRETNSVIAKLADRLPVQLNPADTSYGLVYIYPVGRHYVVVCSGKPWWPVNDSTSKALFAKSSLRFMSGPISLIMGDDDYIFYKGSMDDVIASGRFDDTWQVPAADATKMELTGQVNFTDR